MKDDVRTQCERCGRPSCICFHDEPKETRLNETMTEKAWQRAFEDAAEGNERLTGQVVKLRKENERLRAVVEAARRTVARADDYADSYISRPIRDALSALDAEQKHEG